MSPDTQPISAELTREFRTVTDPLLEPIVASDETGTIVYLNPAAARLLGWSVADLLGRPLSTLMPPRLRAMHEAGFRNYILTGRSRIIGKPVRLPALRQDGIEIDVELALSDTIDPRTGRHLIVATMRDLKDLIYLERQLVVHRRIFAQYSASAVLAAGGDLRTVTSDLLKVTVNALEWDVGIFWALNPVSRTLAIAASFASSPSVDSTFLEACREQILLPGEALVGEVLRSGQPVATRKLDEDERYARTGLAAAHGLRSALLVPVACANKTHGVMEFLSTRLEEPDEELLQTMRTLGFQLGQFLERREAEVEVRASARREAAARAEAEAQRNNLEALFMQAPAAIAVLRGPDLRYELSNPMNQVLAGGRELVGRTAAEALPELEADGLRALADQVYATGEPIISREMPVTLPATSDREARRIFMTGIMHPLRDAAGRIDGIMVFAYEVTDLVAARARVEETEQRLRLAVEAGNIGTWEYDPRTRAIRCDPKYRMFFGLSAAEQPTADLIAAAIHPDDRQRADQAIEHARDRAAGGEYAAEFRTIGPSDGFERWLAVRGRMLFDERGEAVRLLGTGVDITSEKRALERATFLDDAGTLLSSSLDYRSSLGKLVRLAVPRLADWCVAAVVTEGGEVELFEVAHSDHAKVELARLLLQKYPADLKSSVRIAHVLRTREAELNAVVTDEMIVNSARDEEHLRMLRELGLHSSLLVPLVTHDRAIGFIGLFHADSGRRFTRDDLVFVGDLARRAALAIENARSYRAAQMAIEKRDEFLSIAAHELRTPLAILSLQLERLVRDLKRATSGASEKENAPERVQKSMKQVDRLTRLVNELLDVSRLSSGRLRLNVAPMDLADVAHDVVDRFREDANRVGSPITLQTAGRTQGSWDADRLDQVLTNLLSNALKFAPGDSIGVVVSESAERVRCVVSDRGPGIAHQDQLRIFERFERTAAAQNIGGMGLGLWIVREIVHAHGGETGVDSKPGQGAQFWIELPRQIS